MYILHNPYIYIYYVMYILHNPYIYILHIYICQCIYIYVHMHIHAVYLCTILTWQEPLSDVLNLVWCRRHNRVFSTSQLFAEKAWRRRRRVTWTAMAQRELLPSDVLPEHYDLTLEPDIEKFAFDGVVKITCDVQALIFFGLKKFRLFFFFGIV